MPLEATAERIASLRLPSDFKIEKLADGLQTPRVIVVAPDGTLYISSREAGTISMLRPGTGSLARVILTKPNVHGMAIH